MAEIQAAQKSCVPELRSAETSDMKIKAQETSWLNDIPGASI